MGGFFPVDYAIPKQDRRKRITGSFFGCPYTVPHPEELAFRLKTEVTVPLQASMGIDKFRLEVLEDALRKIKSIKITEDSANAAGCEMSGANLEIFKVLCDAANLTSHGVACYFLGIQITPEVSKRLKAEYANLITLADAAGLLQNHPDEVKPHGEK